MIDLKVGQLIEVVRAFMTVSVNPLGSTNNCIANLDEGDLMLVVEVECPTMGKAIILTRANILVFLMNDVDYINDARRKLKFLL